MPPNTHVLHQDSGINYNIGSFEFAKSEDLPTPAARLDFSFYKKYDK